MEQLIRYQFLKEWILNVSVDEIVEKLIELDDLKKILNMKGMFDNVYKSKI